MRVRAVALALFLVAPHAVAPARAEREPMPLAVVIRGGGSLGAFEAGALYYLTALADKSPGLVDPRLFTGTSAGSINALLSVIEACGDRVPAPAESLFYTTWQHVGVGGLFDPRRARATGVFTREGALADLVDVVRARWHAGLSSSCDVVLGIPVTRVVPRRLPLAKRESLAVSRVEERFVVRVRGRGPGRPPSLVNYLASHPAVASPALVTDAAGEIAFDSLVQIVFASSGVPVVFPPVPVPMCLVTSTPTNGPIVCRPENAEVVELVDGGLLDNQPLRLATTIARHGFADTSPASWLDAPDHTPHTGLPDALAFLVIDPSSMPWLPGDEAPKAQATSLTELLARLLPGVLESAFSAELDNVLVETPEVRERMSVVVGGWPMAGGGLGSLMGFLEEDFRVFDFYLGMVEAHHVALWAIMPWAILRGGAKLPVPDESLEAAAGWRPFGCVRAALEAEPEAAIARACEGVDPNLLAILQTTIDRAAAVCRRLSPEAAKTLPEGPAWDPRARCRQVHDGASITKVPNVPKGGELELGAGDSSHDDNLRFLAGHGFVFRDLGIGRASHEAASQRISALVHDITRALASQQHEDALLWRIAGRTASQVLAYRPPAHALYLLAGARWELGWSGSDPDAGWGWLRLGASFTFDGVASAFDGEERTWLGLTPMLGFEVEPGLSGAGLQVRVGLRGGFRWSTGDDFRAGVNTAEPDAPRSRPVGEVYLAATALQWMRLQMTLAWYPPFEGLGATWALRPMLGLELDLPL